LPGSSGRGRIIFDSQLLPVEISQGGVEDFETRFSGQSNIILHSQQVTNSLDQALGFD